MDTLNRGVQMEIDILSCEVRAGSSVTHLSSIEQSLLYLLASRAGQVKTRDEIMDAVWGTDFEAESNVVDRHIRSLRVKLQNDHRQPRFIPRFRVGGIASSLPSRTGWAGQGEGESLTH